MKKATIFLMLVSIIQMSQMGNAGFLSLVSRGSRSIPTNTPIDPCPSYYSTKSSQLVVAWDLHDVLFTKQGKHGYDCKLRPEMAAIVFKLAKKGVRQVVLSNISAQNFAVLRKRHSHLFACFDLDHSLANAQGIFTRKPHGKYFQKFLEGIDVPASQIVFFDDKSENIKGAEKFGIKAFECTQPGQVAKQLEALKLF